MNWADYDDVKSRWVGGGFPADETQTTTLIGDAEDVIVNAFPTIQDRIDSDELSETTVRRVVARVVIRHLRNPQGYRTVSQGAGPFQQSNTFGGDEPGAMYLTEKDMSDLAPRGSLLGKAFSVDMTPAAFTGHTPNTWEPIQ